MLQKRRPDQSSISVAPYRIFNELCLGHHSALASERFGQGLGCDCVATALRQSTLSNLSMLIAINLLIQEHAQVLDDRTPRFELLKLLRGGLNLLSNLQTVFQHCELHIVHSNLEP